MAQMLGMDTCKYSVTNTTCSSSGRIMVHARHICNQNIDLHIESIRRLDEHGAPAASRWPSQTE